jgi:phage host-nuclease inhibitor protein Gam
MKSTNRVKHTLAQQVIQTREQLEACVGEIARLQIDRDALLVAMDSELQAIRTKYEERIGTLGADIDVELLLAEAWAQDHKAEFGDKKSIELVHGTIGYRTGNPAVVTRKGVTWKAALQLFVRRRLMKYIRRTYALDREAILRDRETLGGAKLAELGLSIEQAETFFVEPKREEVES